MQNQVTQPQDNSKPSEFNAATKHLGPRSYGTALSTEDHMGDLREKSSSSLRVTLPGVLNAHPHALALAALPDPKWVLLQLKGAGTPAFLTLPPNECPSQMARLQGNGTGFGVK